jgi:hypothetical protein
MFQIRKYLLSIVTIAFPLFVPAMSLISPLISTKEELFAVITRDLAQFLYLCVTLCGVIGLKTQTSVCGGRLSFDTVAVCCVAVWVKRGELQIWSLQISSFSRNSSSQLQLPYFRLCKYRLWTMLSQLVMLKKNKHAVASYHSLKTRNL